MVRVFLESKQDQENFKQWIASSGIPEKSVEAVFNKFESFKQALPGDEKSYGWQMKHKEPLEFAKWVKGYVTGTTKKRFVKLFGEPHYNTFTNEMNTSKCNMCKIEGWLEIYDREIAKGKDAKEVEKDLFQRQNKVIEEYKLFSSEQLENIEKGSEIIDKKNGWTAIRIYNYDASKYWGSEAGWCIAAGFGDTSAYFNNYIKDGSVKFYHNGKPFYLFLISNKGDAYACLSFNNIWKGTRKADTRVDSLPENCPFDLKELIGDDVKN